MLQKCIPKQGVPEPTTMGGHLWGQVEKLLQTQMHNKVFLNFLISALYMSLVIEVSNPSISMCTVQALISCIVSSFFLGLFENTQHQGGFHKGFPKRIRKDIRHCNKFMRKRRHMLPRTLTYCASDLTAMPFCKPDNLKVHAEHS